MASSTTFTADNQPSDVIHQLQSFCRGELSAVDTYKQALGARPFPSITEVLGRCLASHERRVVLLRDKIREMGGEVPSSAGAWGTLVTLLGGAASAISEKAAVAVLEQGEDHGLRDYREDLGKLDARTQQFILQNVLPEQVESHEMMATLKHALS